MELTHFNGAQLPATAEKLNQFIIIGKERLNAQKAKIRAIEKTGMAIEAKKAALEDAQDMADILLDAEVKLGKMLEAIPPQSSQAGRLPTLPPDITYKQSHKAQTLSRNADIVEQVKSEARDKGVIPTADHVYKLAQKIKRECDIKKTTDKIERGIDLPEGKFEVIVIDPPWPYGTKYDPDSRRVASPYPEMSIAEISEIVIPGCEDSSLWLWTTHKFLSDSFSLMERWGYNYKATLVWNKEKIGVGHWIRMQVEFCLLGIKGKPIWNMTNERDIITQARTEHSSKPDDFYKMVETICVGRKLDFFGRKARAGWVIYGSEMG